MKKLLATLCAVSALVGFADTLRTAAGADPGYSFYPAPDDSGTFYPWTSDGDNGAKSGGYHVDFANSWMDVVVQGPATITFDWKVDSEGNYDKLIFRDNGSDKFDISGQGGGWRSQNYTITDSNAHVIRFKYAKDVSASYGSDCGWVKNFKVTRTTDLLPAEYIQYASLKTDGSAAINSGYTYVSDTRIDVDWVLDATSSLGGGGGLSLPSGASTLTCKGTSAYFADGTSGSRSYSIGGTASGNSCPLFLLDRAGNLTPGEGEKIVGDIYSFRILDSNNVVQRNMIPCKRISDDVAGFYDTVNGVFYPSVTDVAFTAESRVGGYIITFDADGGEGGTTGLKVMFGDMVPTIEVPTRSGFDFLGYFDENGTQYYDLAGYGLRAWDQDADVTLKASWDADNTSLFLPPGDAGTTYVVSNLTAGVEVEKFCETADGRVVYRLPVGVRASVSCAPSAGCFVVGTNPYVIESVTAGMTVNAAELPRGVTQTLLDLESIFNTANTPTTAELVYGGNGVLVCHRVTLGQNYGPLTLAGDCGAVTIDLNGWMIRGTDGANASGDAPGEVGVAAITVAGTSGGAGATVITVVNDTAAAEGRPAPGSSAGIVGGNGGNGVPPGRGGAAVGDAAGAVYDGVTDMTGGLVKNGNGGLLFGAVYDPTSDFVPTRIVNGDFAEEPWMDFIVNGKRYSRGDEIGNGYTVEHIPNGPGEGWNTTESTTYGPGMFECLNIGNNSYGPPNSDSHGRFIEMNANHNAVFYQDLYTHGGDVILWSLSHGTRSGFGTQTIQVEVGAPNGQASGVGSAVNSNIKTETKAVYTAAGVSNPSGIEYGYNGSLADLSMSGCSWGSAYGIYLIPEGQEVTRFAFIAIEPDGGCGNFLDDLTFSTIIGNLKAKANDDGSVSITGYWGDENLSKHLRIEFDGQTYDLDMSNIHSENFIVTIPHSLISETVLLSVYHEDYPLAKRTIRVQHPNQFTVVADGTEFRAWCTNAAHSVETGCLHHGEENAVRLTFEATDRVYTGLPYDGISLTGDTNEWRAADLPLPAYTYAADGASEFGETPTGAGLYTVKATVKDVYGTDDFEITKAMLTVKADDKSVAVGDAAPAYTATVTGFVNGELAAAAYSGEPAFTCAYNQGDPVGSYSISVALGTLESPNYGFDFAGGTLMVGNIKLTVDSVVCGDPWRTITVNYALDGVDPSTTYKIAFELSVDGETKAVTNETTLSNGPATKVIDTAGLFGEPGADPSAKLRVALVFPVVFDECEFQLMPDSWQVGDGVYAFLDESGALFVFGTGATWDYSSLKQPWASSALKVKRTVVGNNVTEIGNRFYKKCYNMASFTCGKSVVRFGERAFYLCTALESINVSNMDFETECLNDSIVYQMAIDSDGNFVMVPSVGISGYTPMLYGKQELSDPVWKRIGPLAGIRLDTLKADGVYHFFQTRLEK